MQSLIDAINTGVRAIASFLSVGGKDGSGNARPIAVDSSGNIVASGAAASGAAVSGNPVLVAGKDGSGNAETIKTDTSGNQQVVGVAADGAASSGNPVGVGVKNGSGNNKFLFGNVDGSARVSLCQIDGTDFLTDAAGLLLEGAQTGSKDFTFTPPSSASTVAQTAITAIGKYRSAFFWAELTGNTGGTLDIYIQCSPDNGATWIDYGHFAQLAAGAGVVEKAFSITKGAQQTTITAVGKNASPALAANTILGGDWGDRMRIVAVSGASTSASFAQNIKAIFTT